MALMKMIENPERKEWVNLLARPVYQAAALEADVRKIMDAVKVSGDRAVDLYAEQFDQVTRADRLVSVQEFDEAAEGLDESLKTAIHQAKDNITKFHQSQLSAEPAVEIHSGIRCWRKSVAIEKVGLYIPGGTAPLFSTLLMLGVPATLAGCGDIIVCTPPQKDGRLNPAILFAAKILGLKKVFKIGGVQAIAAMAYGTETIPGVYKIFGPGNQYVTKSKQLLQQEGVAIDMPAGPSELAIFADETANPAFVAADLLSQCEHGTDSQVILVTTLRKMAERVNEELAEQIKKLPRKPIASKSLENSKIFLMPDAVTSLDLLNQYAPEHLILACQDAVALADKVRNAGSVFIGNYAPESAGDYASGTNHTLPTNGYARVYSGVSTDSFMKKISFQQLSKEGLASIGNAVMEMARAEGLEAHAAAVEIRLANLQPKI